ncbi:DUF4159 domain-containing protein [Candidatus Latescibacterota bacterium]
MNSSEKSKSNRFKGYAHFIDIIKLERETQKILYLGFVVAILFYFMLGSLVKFRKSELRVNKPIEVRFIVKSPRMTKPFVIQQKENQKKILKKEIVRIIPPGDFIYKEKVSLLNILEMADSLEYDLNLSKEFIALVLAGIDSIYYSDLEKIFEQEGFDYRRFIADAPGYNDGITREEENVLSFKDLLLTAEDYDTGQYKGMIVKDPSEKQNIKGFIHIPVDIWGTLLRPNFSTHGLMNGFAKYTGINVKIDPHVYIDSPALLKYPFLYISASSDEPFDIAAREKENLLEYFSRGGLVLFDPSSLQSYYGMRKMITDACNGREQISPIENDSPILHTFYDFDEMPVLFPPIETEGGGYPILPPDGVWLDGRLVAIIPPSPGRPFGSEWQESEGDASYENPSFRLAVNMIVYSLIREGSISEKFVNTDESSNNVRSEAPWIQ